MLLVLYCLNEHGETWADRDDLKQALLMRKYLRSLYWAFTTMTTVGYGDIVPVTILETGYSIFVMLIGGALYAAMIANVTAIISAVDSNSARFAMVKSCMKSFLVSRSVPQNVEAVVFESLETTWAAQKGVTEEAIMKLLPPSLRSKLKCSMYLENIKGCPHFRGFGAEMLMRICALVRDVYVVPNECVFAQDSMAVHFYLLVGGNVDLIKYAFDDLVGEALLGDFGDDEFAKGSNIQVDGDGSDTLSGGNNAPADNHSGVDEGEVVHEETITAPKYFGSAALLERGRYTVAAYARTGCTLRSIDTIEFRRALVDTCSADAIENFDEELKDLILDDS